MDFVGLGVSRANYLFELGKIRCQSGNFLGSTRLLEEASSLYLSQKDYSQYMECISILLRMYKELEDTKKIQILKEDLTELAWEENFKISSRLYYTLGQCAIYKGQLAEARELFEKSANQVMELKINAQKTQNPISILKAHIESCLPVFGMVYIFILENNIKDSIKELNALENILHAFYVLKQQKTSITTQQVRDHLQSDMDMLKRVENCTQVLKVLIYRMQKRYVEAETLLWKCYEQVKDSKDMFSLVSFFYYLGQNYIDMYDYNQARIFLNLAKKSIDTDNFKHLYIHVQKCLDKLQFIDSSDYDLIINLATHSVVEKHKGRVNFKNQNLLLDLLKLFVSRPGMSYSKADIVSTVWKQEYNPLVHDNKIYVTIKRLRELVEPDIRYLRYIFCGKSGYYLNMNARILVKDQKIQATEQVSVI